jgi:hypothetical protein
MVWPLVAAMLPVGIGLTLGSTPLVSHGLLHHARTVAIVVTVTVVGLVLLPEAWHIIGAWAPLLFALGLGTPMMIERLMSALPGGGVLGHRAADELAFAAFVVHQLVDGLQIGAAWLEGEGWTITAVIALHSIPLVAAITLRYAADDEARLAPRAFLLLAATVVGTIIGNVVIGALPGEAGWLPALIGGLLLHVLWHDFPHHVHEH